jgi:hypothetical protein
MGVEVGDEAEMRLDFCGLAAQGCGGAGGLEEASSLVEDGYAQGGRWNRGVAVRSVDSVPRCFSDLHEHCHPDLFLYQAWTSFQASRREYRKAVASRTKFHGEPYFSKLCYYALRHEFARGFGARLECWVNRNADGRCEYK